MVDGLSPHSTFDQFDRLKPVKKNIAPRKISMIDQHKLA
jgi:hypothetical protein